MWVYLTFRKTQKEKGNFAEELNKQFITYDTHTTFIQNQENVKEKTKTNSSHKNTTQQNNSTENSEQTKSEK